MPTNTRPVTRGKKNPDRRHRTSLHTLKPGASLQAHIEWALDVPTTPREKLVLIALAARPGATPEHLERRTGMTVHAVKEAIDELLNDGWVYHAYDGGYLVDVAAEEVREFPIPQSALAAELAQTLSASA